MKNEEIILLVPVLLMFGFMLGLPIMMIIDNNYVREETIQVVAIEKVQPTALGWPHTSITYTDLQLNAVTELNTHYLTVFGTYHNIEPGHIYNIKYKMQWNWRYPQIEEITDVTANYREVLTQ